MVVRDTKMRRSRLVGDLESNGLYLEATTIWCGVFKDIDTQDKFIFPPDKVYLIPRLLEKCDELIMHNGMGFDRLLMMKILGYEFPLEKLTDTLILSRLLNPDRKSPPGWKGKPAPHSVDAWGMRLGRAKPVHEDWSQYSPEMLHRCDEDVEIQTMIYYELLKEMGDV